ncbi:hypothetical protein PHYSODRAFT_527207 [Phytophthora sojae]|uniref:FAD-binding FR-type domain-containing protein n=1 Tax=Phytophthora sojae (strain P6497) TaxID=1094619 RepID=G5A8N3_PHYSP|nr:hypothetical protein PHYSODRAFT_527207 [Phytophthora sojae]EGZ08259.1 hypothetical protein PHYSODRAFT_527207 [Phytophthora sojae]|eukprot:XP_009536431.1 hypothetical protein PHYSODRAFT_527207 [Phytophthora sojae]
MTTLDSPKTPRADYAAVTEDGTKTLNTQPSLPILASGGRPDMWEPSSARSGDYDYANDLQTAPPSRSKPSCLPSPLRKLARTWMVLRWQLSRSFFSVPLPFLTSMFDVKLGDLIITLPICLVFIITTAMQAINDREVEGSGGPPTYGLLVVFILTVRNNSVLLALTGISYERVLFYHKIAALVTIALSGLHGLAYILAYDKGEISGQGSMVFSGTVAFGAMVLMFVFSLGFVRRRFFEFFLRTHWVLFIVVLVFAVMHGASTALIGVIPWGIDMAFRHAYRPQVYARGSMIGGNKTVSEDAPASVVSNKRMGVIARDQVTVTSLPGNYVFLCVLSISKLQWHPFTISSSPHEPMVTFHIKALGDWTYKLQSMVTAVSGGADVTAPFDILVDGPYGSVSIDIESPATYSHFVLFSGGIGVTPMRSIVNWLHHDVHHGGRSGVERVHFVWSVRDRDMVRSLVVDEAYKTGEYKGESYFPNGIVNDRGGAFSSEIYLTRSEQDIESAEIDRHLNGRYRYGARPDVAATLRSIGEQAKQSGKKRVAVLVCGPSSMVSDVINKSLNLSWEMKVHFDVHSEVFEF